MRQAHTRSPSGTCRSPCSPTENPSPSPASLLAEFSPIPQRAWRTVQDQLTHLVPGAEYVIATGAGLVRAAIKVNAVRAGRHTATPSRNRPSTPTSRPILPQSLPNDGMSRIARWR
jgi:hypothetical protein